MSTASELEAYRRLHQEADDLLRGIYENRVAWSARQTAHEKKMRACYACVKPDPAAFTALQRLLNYLTHRTELVRAEPVVAYLGPQAGNTYLDALLMLALNHAEWRSEPEYWEPETTDAKAQFYTLSRHLFAVYPVPAFLDAAWFEGFSEQGDRHRHWFRHIGGGQNVRTAPGPIALTKMAAHHFLLAPEASSIVGALRWGQVLGLGGGEHLAQAIAESKLGEILPDEPFWASVIHFFVNNPKMDVNHVGPIVDYIYYQKFGQQSVPGERGRVVWTDAPQPDFEMKGRTLVALQRSLHEWHEELAKEAKRQVTNWPSSGIDPFSLEERDKASGTTYLWSIRELTDSRQLQEEGSEMRHCVRTYADGCVKGTTSIWSLRAQALPQRRSHRLLTIEVNNRRRAIVQVRGKCNLGLGSYRNNHRMRLASEMIRRWARQEHLGVSASLL